MLHLHDVRLPALGEPPDAAADDADRGLAGPSRTATRTRGCVDDSARPAPERGRMQDLHVGATRRERGIDLAALG